MAKKVRGTSEASVSAVSKRPRARRFYIYIICLLALGLLVFALVPKWHRAALEKQIRLNLPSVPDNMNSPVFAALLKAADLQARTARDPLPDVAELGRLYHANGLYHQAKACWQILQHEEPANAHWCYYLADLSRTESDYQTMNAWLLQTAKLAPDYSPALLKLADWELKTGNWEAASQDYTKRLNLVPNDMYARLGLARIALQHGEREKAGQLLEAIVKDSPAFSTGHNLYAEYLTAGGNAAEASRQRWLGRETGRFREADDPWLDELTSRCYDYQRLLVLGTVDFQTERGDKGESFFKRAIQVAPGVYPAYELLARLYLKINEPAKARDTLEEGERRASVTKPSAMYYVNLSHAYRELKQPEKAVSVAREGLEKIGDGLELEDALGVALGAMGQYEDAIVALHQGLVYNPNDSDSNFNLAICLQAIGREDDAVAALHRSLILQPTFPNALLLLARRDVDAGRLEAAEIYLQPLYESHPEIPEVRELALRWRLASAKAAEAKKDYAVAERQYRGAIAIDNTDPELVSQLGVLFLVEGKFDDAVAPLESYYKARPNNPRGALYLGQVYAMLGRFPEARKTLTAGIQSAEREANPTTAKNCREILQSLPE